MNKTYLTNKRGTDCKMRMILFTFFAIKKPPRPQSARVKRQERKMNGQYTNIIRQSYPPLVENSLILK